MNAPEFLPSRRELKDHELVEAVARPNLRYEKRPATRPDGSVAAGLYNAWITLDNPGQYNSYTTDMVKGVILAFRAASNARDVNCVVFTGAGDKAFCTGGNTKEYAEYYAGHPQEYRQYMRLFNDMVSAILACDKPVICRVNGMRIGGGQEIGMACDFSVAQDLARFGQAGPKHGSAPIGGATDFLPVLVGAERAMAACVLCEPFSAHRAYQMGVLTDIVPALKVDGRFVANPLVETQRAYDEFGRLLYGEFKSGRRGARGQGGDGGRHGRPVAARRQGRGAVRQDAADLPRLHDQDARGAAQAQARRLEPQQGELARLARPEHGHRGARRVHRLQRGPEGRPRGRLRAAAPEARRRRKLGRADARRDPAEEGLTVSAPVRSWDEQGGALLRLRLDRPKANIVDAAMIGALHGALDSARQRTSWRGVLLDAEGPNFSFGASVEEHLAGRCAAMLSALHALVLEMLAFPAPILVAVRGQCLGGGLEVALAGGPVFAAPDARFAQPEIRLGVFAPAASVLLPYRVGTPAAEDLLFSGRAIGAVEAQAIGLVREVADDPAAAALAWFEAHLAGKSAAALRCALVAARAPMLRDVPARLAEVERLYLDRLMATRDANEGLDAFLAKRQPSWEHR